jgi:F-type H+-transporting ATPase subunit epsilon
MNLEIISPEKILFSGVADSVTLPGMSGSFMILNRHAPIISALEKGAVSYHAGGKDEEIAVNGGFVEAKNDNVSVCIE